MPGVQQHLKDDAIDYLVCASRVPHTLDDEVPLAIPGPSVEQQVIGEEEKSRVRNFRLEDSESDRDMSEEVEQRVAAAGDSSEEESEDQGDSDTNSTYSDRWERTLEGISQLKNQQPCHSLKQRQLWLIATGVRRAVHERDSEVERVRVHVLEETKRRWISLGMMKEDDAHLLHSVKGPYHPNMERSREVYFARKKEDLRLLEEKACQYYQHEWVLTKEEELRQLQKQEDAATDDEVKHAQWYMMELTVDALKLRFPRYGCLHSKRNIFTAYGALYCTLAIAKTTSRTRSNCSLPRRAPIKTLASRWPAARNVALRMVKPPQYQTGGGSPTSSTPIRSKFTNSIPMFSFRN